MKREELIKKLKHELKEISDSYIRDIDILEKIKPDTVYRTDIYGESLVRVMSWGKGYGSRRVRVMVLANKGRGSSTIDFLFRYKGVLNLVCFSVCFIKKCGGSPALGLSFVYRLDIYQS